MSRGSKVESRESETNSTLQSRLSNLAVAAWLVLVIVVYFRLQLERVLKLVGALP